MDTFIFGFIPFVFKGLPNAAPSSVIFKTSSTVIGGRLFGAETRLRPDSVIDPSATSCRRYCLSAIRLEPLIPKALAISRLPTEPLELLINSFISSASGKSDTFFNFRATTLLSFLKYVFVII